MSRLAASLIAACSLAAAPATVAAQPPPAAAPFPVVGEARPPERSHTFAYLSMAVGAALIGASFEIAHRADETYDDYRVATDERAIEDLYDRTIAYDRWARATLLGGEGLVALGLYLRFVRRPAPQRLAVELSPARCALSVRF
jgi:hypothetical protein